MSTDNESMGDDLVRLTRVKAHVSHSRTGKVEQVREHMDSRKAAEEKAATGISAGKGVFNGPARASVLRDKSGKLLGHDGARIAAAGHPGATVADAKAASATKAATAKKPLSDEEYAAHTAHIEKTLTEHAHLATDRTHGLGNTPEERASNAEKGLYSPERAKLHKEIVNSYYEKQAATAKSEGKAVISGGLGGAGKSTVLKNHKEIDPSHYVTANPDDMKEELAKRGLVPEAGDLSPMERAGLVHEESSHLANLVAKRAYHDKKNIIHDITMSSTKSTQRRVDELHTHGYGHVKGMFVDIPVETSVARALGRHRRGMEAHRNGHGEGGRYVSPTIIRKNVSDKSSSANRDVFEGLKPQFDSWEVHDSSSDTGLPKLVSSSAHRTSGGWET